MLDRAHRLRRRGDFTAAVRAGRRSGRATLVVHLLPGEHTSAGGPEAPPRVGFVVGRAVGGAVVRNRVRRRLRHIARERLAELPPGSMLVVRALPAAAGASSGRLRSDLAAALRSATRTGAPSSAKPASASGARSAPERAAR